MTWISIFLKGSLVGIANIIPGLSGGTVAVILGIYDRLIESLSQFNVSWIYKWDKTVRFLIVLVLGALVGILFFSYVIDYLLRMYSEPVSFFFLGTVVSSLPYIVKKERSLRFSVTSMVCFIVCMLITLFFVYLSIFSNSEDQLLFNVSLTMVFFSSVIASAAMIIPGISGSMILLLFGTYSTVVSGIKSLDIIVCGVVCLGVLCGIVCSSRAIQYCLTQFHNQTYWGILGLIVGTLPGLYPGFDTSIFVINLICFIFGFFIVWLGELLPYFKS